MGRKVVLATSSLKQWAMDFQGNCNRILESIQLAKSAGATYRSGPELEITGYSCYDHFYENDTFLHSWEVVAELLQHPSCTDILVDVGLPILHKNAAYNCRLVFFNGKVVFIRPKKILADNGIYRESRWFSPWQKHRETEEFFLPRMIRTITGQSTVPFGDGVISSIDTCIGFEMCEELWNPDSPHIPLGFDGVEIFVNSSGSYTEIRKSSHATDYIKVATAKCGGCYLFSNLVGCDGDRVYFPGGSKIVLNGSVVATDTPYCLSDVQIVTAVIDLESIRMFRHMVRSRFLGSSTMNKSFPRIQVNFSLSGDQDLFLSASSPIEVWFPNSEEEVLYGPACWLWDYLRRSCQGGFLLPLSGGVDSCASATVVYSMCCLVVDAISRGEDQVLDDVRRIVSQPNYVPSDSKELCGRLFHTIYMATENSSSETKERAKRIASEIGSYHIPVGIDSVVSGALGIFSAATGYIPKFKVRGGTPRENLALQNVQARLRMVLAYLFAQLLLWARGRAGGLLVLGSSNVDECLRGYMTKYDCSSADINPIGGFSKKDINKFLVLAKERLKLPVMDEILRAAPTAELEPLAKGRITQTDETDMGMTYDELSTYGRLRKVDGCGPYSMFCKLVHMWSDEWTPDQIAEKVKIFFRYYSMNRHKMTVLTPAYHAESYSPDDHRFDHRPFLYNLHWSWQFRSVDKAADLYTKEKETRKPQNVTSFPLDENPSSSSDVPRASTFPRSFQASGGANEKNLCRNASDVGTSAKHSHSNRQSNNPFEISTGSENPQTVVEEFEFGGENFKPGTEDARKRHHGLSTPTRSGPTNHKKKVLNNEANKGRLFGTSADV